MEAFTRQNIQAQFLVKKSSLIVLTREEFHIVMLTVIKDMVASRCTSTVLIVPVFFTACTCYSGGRKVDDEETKP